MSYLLRILALSCLLSACGGGDSADSSGANSQPKKFYTVSTQANAGGSISPQSIEVEQGQTANFEVTLDEGYRLDDIQGCDGTIDNLVYTTAAIAGNCQIQVTFTQTFIVSGVAQLGMVSGATVKLFALPNKELIAESITSSQSGNYGAFSFTDLVLQEQAHYLIEVSGGTDLDPNFDGVAVEGEGVTLQGKLRALITGKQLIQGPVHVTALSDMLYVQLEDSVHGTDLSSVFTEELSKLSRLITKDINQDGLANYQDILGFVPQRDSSQLNINYADVRDFYIPLVYENFDKIELLRSLLFIFKYQINTNVHDYQIVPFSFSADLSQLPDGIDLQWQVNQVNYAFNEAYPVSEAGNVELSAILSYQGEVIGQLSKSIQAAEVEKVKSGQSSATENLYVDLSSSFGLGAGITVPAGASSDNITIEVNKLVDGAMPIDNTQVSETIVLYPAGATFEKPVTIALPYYSDAAPENLRIVRYSDDGDKDYLTASYIDEENKLVYFETEHFTSFTVEEGCFWETDNCLRLERNFDKIKALLKKHYTGSVDYSNWDDETWEQVLNTCLNEKECGSTVYDRFLQLNNLITLVQVLDDNYQSLEHPNGINEDYKYLSAYNFLYQNDSTIKAATERWEDIKSGLELIQAYKGLTGVSIAADGVKQMATASLQMMASTLGMFDLPPSASVAQSTLSTIDFTDGGINQNGIPISPASAASLMLDWLNVPMYNPIKTGGLLIKAANNIGFNSQIATYLRERELLGIEGRVTLDDFLTLGVTSLTGKGKKLWFGSGRDSFRDLNSTSFFNNVEDMYQYYANYKKMHASPYEFYNDCGSQEQPCEESLFELTPEANFIALMMAAHKKVQLKQEQEYRENNPSFSIDTYQVNGGKVQEFDSLKGLSLHAEKGQSVTVSLIFDVKGSDDYVNDFDPELAIKKFPCKVFESCDELQGLTYSTVTYINGDGLKAVDIDFVMPSSADTYYYEMEFSYKSLLHNILDSGDKLTITINEENENQPPSVEIHAPDGLVFTSGEEFTLEAIASDDGEINSYEWLAWLGNEELSVVGRKAQVASYVAPEVDTVQTMVVYLNVVDDGGKLATTSQEITIKPINTTPPNANAGEDQTVVSGELFSLDASQSTDDEDASEQLSYLWQQIDDTGFSVDFAKLNEAVVSAYAFDTEESITLTYKVTVTDIAGNSASDTVNITIVRKDKTPSAHAGYNQTAYADKKVFLNGSSSSDEEDDAENLTYLWQQIDDSGYSVDINDIGSAKTYFIAPKVNVRTLLKFRLTVTDSANNSDTSVVEITALPANNKPVANAGEDQKVKANTKVTLIGSASVDQETPIESLFFDWFQVDDSAYKIEIENYSSVNPSFISPNVMVTTTFTIELYIIDEAGDSASDTVDITVEPTQAVTEPVLASISPKEVVSNTTGVTFTATGENFPDTLAMALEDSTSCSEVTVSGSSSASITCDIPDTTKSQLAFYIKDKPGKDGGTIILGAEGLTVNVSAANEKPIADAGSNQSVKANSMVTLNANGSSDNETPHNELTFSWQQTDSTGYQVNLSDADSSQASFVAPDVNNTTTLAFTLTVTDGDSKQDADTVYITVAPAQPDTEPSFASIHPTQVISATAGVTFTVTGENFPNTLAMALEDSATCSEVTVNGTSSASITCDIPDTAKSQLAFYIKDKPGKDAGAIISGAEGLMIDVTVSNDNGFIQPCRDCGYSGPYDRDWHGDGTTHLAKDYPAFVGDNVLAIARGQVVKILTDAAGFGGAEPSLPGGAIVLMHTKANGDNFYALYGHVSAVNGLAVDDIVAAGEVVGTVEHYYVGTDNGQEDWPHLHFGIWDAESDFPTVNLGYGEVRSFVDPVPFLVSNQPELITEAISLSPLTVTAGQSTSFTLTGENIPSSVAMSLAGSETCSSVYGVTTSSAQIDCTPQITGIQKFYVKNKSGGVFLRGNENMQVEVQDAPQDDVVLGVTFTDTQFALCVQEHVDAEQVSNLADLTSLDCNLRNISDVTELSHMTGLVTLYLQNNPIVEVNLDANQALDTANLLNTNLSQVSLDYLATVTWIANLSYPSNEPPQEDTSSFITTWQVGAGQQITIPTNPNYTYDYQVDWGDGSAITSETGDASHTYTQAGTYNVKINGVFPAIFFNNSGSKDLIYSIEQWGNIEWKSMRLAFAGCINLRLSAVDSPNLASVSDMAQMFRNASSFDGDLSTWNVDNISDMSYLFYFASSFNGDISAWDVSKVINMSHMFMGASKFNGDISNWRVGSVTNMYSMFSGATLFNSDLSRWDVSSVTNTRSMFEGAIAFNSDLSSWDVSSVTSMTWMFRAAYAFNSDLSFWDVSSVQDMGEMFAYSKAFNGDISNWNVGNVTSMHNMFMEALAFNRDISSWDVASVTTMQGMFSKARAFNQNLSSWNVGAVTNMSSMFDNATSFNHDLSSWNVSNVVNMSNMFNRAIAFNQDISSWNVSAVNNMSGMFQSATAFNQDISSWNVSAVNNMSGMFQSATAFNQDISSWNVGSVTNMSNMFAGAIVFNQSLSSWDVSVVTNMSSMFGGAFAFNQEISSWDVSAVKDMSSMFAATNFNRDISGWDVSSVENMYHMFSDAFAFDGDISNWNVSNVTNMSWMFGNNHTFSKDISNWDVSSVTNMDYMFYSAKKFSSDLSTWNVANVISHVEFSTGSPLIEPNWTN